MQRVKKIGLIKKVLKMVIIVFSDKTHLSFVRLVCRHFKHCAVITEHANKLFLHQFVSRGNVTKIAITKRGIAQLKSNGWVFIYLPKYKPIKFNPHAWTCVNYVKQALGINKFWIQTPNALYRYLKKI